jgi:xylitol oxidase
VELSTPGSPAQRRGSDPVGTNWAGNHTYRAQGLVRPRSVDEVCELVARSPAVRAIGSRHSFSDLTDTRGTLVDLAGIPADVRIDAASASVAVGGAVRYGDLAAVLQHRGWALAAMASLPHISVAGAVATGTHGSGDRTRSLAASVRALEVVGPDGGLRRVARGDPDFDGSVVGLGALGIVTRVELDLEPTFDVCQDVRTGLAWEVLESRFDEITGAAYSVSLFTRYDAAVDQLWLKRRAGEGPPSDLFGTVPADRTLHMLPGGSERAVTRQGGVPGPWLERLPHFRQDFTPSRGAELQSEYLVPRERALEAVDRLRGLASGFAPLLLVGEIRTIASDELWLSGAYRREAVGLHFTWVREEGRVRRAVRDIEEALVPLGARPHWGKVFEMDAAAIAEAFPRLRDFTALRDRVDPQRVFGNAFLDRVLGRE